MALAHDAPSLAQRLASSRNVDANVAADHARCSSECEPPEPALDARKQLEKSAGLVALVFDGEARTRKERAPSGAS